jgi:hypothetical protein
MLVRRLFLSSLLAFCACTFKVGLGTNRGLVEKMIVDNVLRATGVKPTHVSCPTIDAGAEFGHGPFDCTVIVEGSELHYHVTNGEKSIHFEQDAAYILVADVEKKLPGVFAHFMADQTPTVTCQPPRVRVSRAGDEIACDMTAGSVHGWAIAHVKDSDGTILIRGGRDGTEMGHSEVGAWVRRALVEKALRDHASKKAGHAPTKVACPGNGEVIEAPGNDFSCTVTVDASEVIYDLHLTLATLNLHFEERPAPLMR